MNEQQLRFLKEALTPEQRALYEALGPIDTSVGSRVTVRGEKAIVLKQSNIGLLVMYCQSGKTEVVLKDIVELVDKGVVCVLFSDNNRILTEQTNIRASKKKILSASIISTAKKGSSNDEFKNFDKFRKLVKTPGFRDCQLTCKEAIEDGRVNTIMVCSNTRRWSDVESIVETCTALGKQVAIFVDEADKTCQSEEGKPIVSINNWHNSCPNVVKIQLITATPYNRKITSKKIKWLGDKFGDKLQLNHLEHPFGSDYRALKNCRHISYQNGDTPGKVDYVVSYLEQSPPKSGLIDFLPADYKRISHEEMVDSVLGTYYDAIIIINGKHKQIRFSDDRAPILFKNLDGAELCDKLGKWFRNNNGKGMKIAITGYLCLGRGITFSTDEYGFYIDRMIISDEDKVAEAIQLMSRCAGYTQHTPTVICPDLMWKMVNVDFEVIRCIIEKSVTYTEPADLVICGEDVRVLNTIAMNKFMSGFVIEKEVLTFDQCIEKGMRKQYRHKSETGDWIASRNLLTGNKERDEATIQDNPTIEYLITRGSGLKDFGIEHCRWEPLRDGMWLRYWKEKV
tara:strand:- start:256 stop:1956 length:1701 start_codon:yes stop_codon:yes gene_type:complete